MLAGIVLAAGLSSRMGAEKLLLPFGAGTVLEATLSRIPLDILDHLVVVTRKEISDVLDLPANVTVILNRTPQKGQSESLRLGITYLRSHFPNCRGVLVFLGDQPLTKRPLIIKVIKVINISPAAIVVPEYQGFSGHPVGFGSAWFDELEAQNGDIGGRRLISNHSEAVIRIQGDETSIMDMDSKADYWRLLDYAEKHQSI
ncbi:nucleotidyltransferase family protein [Acetobacterium wieringae]|uniref:nucleotidyltransferase family protein n=1 Tax=Acetobacterium wieringae TaxID=52694 RepID=UPI0031597729